MSPRRRSNRKKDWPAHLYERGGYYSWRNPIDRKEHGLGRDFASARLQAIEANIHVAGLTGKPRLLDRITGDSERSIGKWNDKYQSLLDRQGFADNTRRTYKSLGKRMVAMLGTDTPLKNVTALQVSEGLEAVAVKEGKARTAQALRNFMRNSFREAIVQGWRDDNPVRETKLSVSVKVKRARLSFEVFMQVYNRVTLDWLKNAMALALVSAQRREDISLAQFKDFHDGGWWCVQESEKATHPHRIFIPLALRLDCFGMSLEDVVNQCRRTGVVSKYLVHQTKPRGNSPVGRRIWIDTLSRRFSEFLAELKLDWGAHTPPTFHEIRSLSERLYAAQGGINTQELLGHNDPETTALYHDSRGSEWVRIKVPV